MIADIVETLGGKHKPRLVEMGKIKIGGLGDARQAAGGRSYRVPQKHDHFTITGLQRGPDRNGARGDLLPDKALMDALVADGWADPDGKLRQIPIRLLSDDLDEVMQTAWVWYGKTTAGARTDGRTVTWYYHPENNQRYDPPMVEDFRPEILEWTVPGSKTDQKLFKLHSVFNCVIAAKVARWGGVYKFRTTSVISFNQLYSSLVHLSQLTGGILVNMPLVLKVRVVQVAPDGKPTTVPVVHVELLGSEMHEIQKLALAQAEYRTVYRQKLMVAQQQYRALLVAPGEEGHGEAGEIAEEFAPESQELGAPAAPESGYGLIGGDDEEQPVESKPVETPPPAPSDPAAPDPVPHAEIAALFQAKRPAELAEGEVASAFPKYVRAELLKGRDAKELRGKTTKDLWEMVSLEGQVGVRDALAEDRFPWATFLPFV